MMKMEWTMEELDRMAKEQMRKQGATLEETVRSKQFKKEKEMMKMEVKDSGNRRSFESGAVRDMQEGKGRCDLLPACALLRLAKHYEAGAKKYDDRNWEKGMPVSVMVDSGMRHLLKYLDGQNDEDHLGAAAWNILGAMWMEEKRPDMQDLPSRRKDESVPDIYPTEKMWRDALSTPQPGSPTMDDLCLHGSGVDIKEVPKRTGQYPWKQRVYGSEEEKEVMEKYEEKREGEYYSLHKGSNPLDDPKLGDAWIDDSLKGDQYND
jgi:hypothetical protein